MKKIILFLSSLLLLTIPTPSYATLDDINGVSSFNFDTGSNKSYDIIPEPIFSYKTNFNFDTGSNKGYIKTLTQLFSGNKIYDKNMIEVSDGGYNSGVKISNDGEIDVDIDTIPVGKEFFKLKVSSLDDFSSKVEEVKADDTISGFIFKIGKQIFKIGN